MWHCCAFTEVIDNTANVDIQPVVDDILQIQNNHFVPDRDLDIYWIWAGAATIARARLNSPKIRQIAPNYIRPVNANVQPSSTNNVDYKVNRPLRVARQEEIAVEATSTVAMTERFTAIMGIGDGIIPAPEGDLYRIRFTSTTAATANAWSTLLTTFETLLPTGRYAVTYCFLQSANAQAARCIFDNQYFRPGNLSGVILGASDQVLFQSRPMGVYGYFNTVTLPRIQTLCNGADAAHEGYLEVVRVGPA